MAPAVIAVLDRVFFPALQRGTCLETRMTFARFQTELESRSLAASGPHSGRIPGSRRRQIPTKTLAKD